VGLATIAKELNHLELDGEGRFLMSI
jgi:hypothetical protein